MDRFKVALLFWGRIERNSAILAFCSVVIINITQIVLRYVFEYSIFWVQEISQLLMLYAYFVGTSSVFRIRGYVLVEFFTKKMSIKLQRLCYGLAQILTIIIYWIIEELPRQMKTYSVILHIPRFFSYLPLLIGSISITAITIYYSIEVLMACQKDKNKSISEIEAAIKLI
jgi:TRAP-type C4-dicarboxylate transport system permease small subunit